jgi:uncharacterized protein (DUF952 family)
MSPKLLLLLPKRQIDAGDRAKDDAIYLPIDLNLSVNRRSLMNTILHITYRDRWETAKNLGTYRSDSLATEGFIHCSTLAQVIGSANRFFKQQTDLVILIIDVDRVTAEIKYEGADPQNLFPHIYGTLNIDAVTQSLDLESNPDGSFMVPKELIS